MQIEYTQATTESFDGQPSHEDILGNTVGGGEVIPPNPTPVNLAETITGSDYGKSINYKATVQGQEISNWRIFLNDGKNVYIILDDYLPVSLVPTATGLTTRPTEKTYSVWSSVSRDALLTALTTPSHWSEFANGVDGAIATGSPTNGQFVESWNANPVVNERELKPETLYYGSTNGGPISDPTRLYVTHTEQVAGSCDGYWLASSYIANTGLVWFVSYGDGVNGTGYSNETLGIRPVVCLPSGITGNVGETVEIQ